MTATRRRRGSDIDLPAAVEQTLSACPLFRSYDTGAFYDEMFTRDADGELVPREHYAPLVAQLKQLSAADLHRAGDLANRSFLHQGITFTVYSDSEQGTERIFPFDLIPRIIPAHEWDQINRGLIQRIKALNLFIHDIYHDQQICTIGLCRGG